MCASRLISRKWLYRSGIYSWNSKLISIGHIRSCSTPTWEAYKSARNRPKKSHICAFLQTSTVLRSTRYRVLNWHLAPFSSPQTSSKEESPRWWQIFGMIVFLSKLWNVWGSLFHFYYDIPNQSASEPWQIFPDLVSYVKGSYKVTWSFGCLWDWKPTSHPSGSHLINLGIMIT